ncbi:GDSL-type esterase/lipase family protein [Arthrobacter burdickii]|uniref:SGNH/GDSL hydrolase family protein n=1 Tax=Arthrobacter burdickii TaxID=3035920 RepID=A0ABT8JYJ7_9MICC|nr:GDSL-type esterase/lipase family protein [Arthrobacter burdickii]MDN4610144.1 SGNH/GDSL hydrolase family protein [Arthrobacter burdickii]
MSDGTRDLIVSALRGALDVEHTARGLVPHRLPRSVDAYHDEETLRANATQPSGVRLALATAANKVTLTALSTRRFFPGMDPESVEVPYGAVSGGLTVEQREIEGSYDLLQLSGPPEHHPGTPASLVFEFRGDGTVRDVEIWLPNNATVEILDLQGDAPIQAAPPSDLPRWTHYGSSISHCAEADSPLSTWPAVAARELGLNLTSLAFGGGAHLDHFVARVIGDLDADLISLKIGINIVNGDTMKRRTFIPAVHAFLDTIREAQPHVPILLISPIACPMQENDPGPITWDLEAAGLRTVPSSMPGQNFGSLTLTDIRSILAGIVDARSVADPALYYLDGLELFGPDDAPDLPDGLHPNTAGYLRMGNRFVGNEHTNEWLRGTRSGSGFGRMSASPA